MAMDSRQISDLAREIRIQILHTIKGAGMGHIGGDFSVAVIWDAIMQEKRLTR
jgi:transketolase